MDGIFGETVYGEARHFFEGEGFFRLYVPFTCKPDTVSELREAHGHGFDPLTDGTEVVVPSVVDGVHACVEAVACRYACRHGIEGIVEFDAFGRDGVDIRSAVVGSPEASDVVPTAVVGYYENKVVAVGGSGIVACGSDGCQTTEHKCAL